MESALFYIEKMTGTNHNGPAWISFVKHSKTGKTIYFNDTALKKKGRGTYFDIETGEEYWISKAKNDGEDRHWAGSGKIIVNAEAEQAYLDLRGLNTLPASQYEIVEMAEGRGPADFVVIENQRD